MQTSSVVLLYSAGASRRDRSVRRKFVGKTMPHHNKPRNPRKTLSLHLRLRGYYACAQRARTSSDTVHRTQWCQAGVLLETTAARYVAWASNARIYIISSHRHRSASQARPFGQRIQRTFSLSCVRIACPLDTSIYIPTT